MTDLHQYANILTLYESAEHTHPNAFARRCFNALHAHVRFETGTLLSLDASYIPNGAYLNDVPSTVVARYFDVVAGTDVQDDYFHELEIQSECAINSIDMFDADEYWQTDIFKDFYLPYRFVHQLGISVPIGISGYRANLYIDRGHFDDAFSEKERTQAEILLRHVMRALRFNLTQWFTIALTPQKNTAYAVSDQHGKILLAQAQFWNITDYAWRKKIIYNLRMLPFVRETYSSSDILYESDGITVTGEALGAYVLLKVVKKTKLQERYLELLTPHERRVAELIAHGYTYKEIAELLSKSYSTAKNQAESIRKKLHLKNTKALYKLFV